MYTASDRSDPIGVHNLTTHVLECIRGGKMGRVMAIVMGLWLKGG